MCCACASRSTCCWNSCEHCCCDFAEKIEAWADAPLIAFTHLQPAEPSTLGYRLAQYAQDFTMDWQALSELRGGTCAARASKARWAPAQPMPS